MRNWLVDNWVTGIATLFIVGVLSVLIVVSQSSSRYVLQSPTESQIMDLYESSRGIVSLQKITGESTLIEMEYNDVWWRHSDIHDVLEDLDINYKVVK